MHVTSFDLFFSANQKSVYQCTGDYVFSRLLFELHGFAHSFFAARLADAAAFFSAFINFLRQRQALNIFLSTRRTFTD